MYDLIYDSSAAEPVRARFPGAVVEDARDMVHDDRISIDVPVSEEEYLRWVLAEGWGAVSLAIQVMIYEEEGAKKVRAWLDEAKKP